jgi:hypothetical protein
LFLPTPVPKASSPLANPDSPAEYFELCNECGGLCCCLYLANDENGDYVGEGWLPEYIDSWEQRLVESGALLVTDDGYCAGAAGVEPLHDPRISHLPTAQGEGYRASLPDWVDVRKCAFCHPQTGCLLPREFRAPICREWVCELWPEWPLTDESPPRPSTILGFPAENANALSPRSR